MAEQGHLLGERGTAAAEIEGERGTLGLRGSSGARFKKGRPSLAMLASVDVDVIAGVRESSGGPEPAWKGDAGAPSDLIRRARGRPRTASLASLYWAAGR